MSTYNASKDGHAGLGDFTSAETLTIGGSGNVAFIRFTGLESLLNITINTAKLKFKAQNSNSELSSINIKGIRIIPTPDTFNIWTDDFDSADLNLDYWWVPESDYDGNLLPSIIDGYAVQSNLTQTTYLYSKIKLIGDFSISARFVVSGPIDTVQSGLVCMIGDGLGTWDSTITAYTNLQTYDVRIRRVNSTVTWYWKLPSSYSWTLGGTETVSGTYGLIKIMFGII